MTIVVRERTKKCFSGPLAGLRRTRVKLLPPELKWLRPVAHEGAKHALEAIFWG